MKVVLGTEVGNKECSFSMYACQKGATGSASLLPFREYF